MLDESIEGLNIYSEGIYADLTFGGGGHSREVLKKLGKKGRLYAFDQDPDAIRNLVEDKRFIFIPANFRFLQNFLRYHNVTMLDGILADLGISSHQIDHAERGFTFRTDAVLDMRMNRNSEKSAQTVLNDYEENALSRIFRDYGEIPNARRVAGTICLARKEGRIQRSAQLEEALGSLVPRNQPSKFLARVYQAVRIEVNEEMAALEEMLTQTTGALKPGGRLVVITYHSLEDRMVKNFMRSGNLRGEIKKDFYGKTESPWSLVNRKVITPSEKELKENSRARSAKLRIAERV